MRKCIPIYLFSLLIFAIIACDNEDPEPENNSNIVEISDDIVDVTTWYSDSVYLIKAWDFYVSNTLTIQAGTIIKFHSDGPDMILGSGGTIIADGTSSEPIIFTSWKDDAHGGDTNGDEDLTSPARKDWGGINTNDNNGSIFNYCEFYYGGNSTYSSTLELYGNNIKVNNCIFAHNSGDDASGWYGVLDASSGGSACEIRNNVFYDNVRPLSISLKYDLDNSNSFSNPDDPTEINTYNGIFVETIDELNAAIEWNETEVAYVIDDNDWWINSGASLTLGDNVCLKFRPGSTLLLDDSDALINYNGMGVLFTSYKDDLSKGDTNGDGDVTLPGTGDWDGIYDNISSAYVLWSNVKYSAN